METVETGREWRSTALAALRLVVSQRQVRYLIAAGDLRAKKLNPRSRRPTWLVCWADVIAYDERRNSGATARAN